MILRTSLRSARNLFNEADLICATSGADVGIVAGTYAAAVQSLIKNGSFNIKDVIDSAKKPDAQSSKSPAAAGPAPTTSQPLLLQVGRRSFRRKG